ncbi:MAG: hypothetical protein PF442_04125 [Desulfobulbaceae bacterium]|jgi:hypothetical protein|nr:hypothetical protein [Desulfobulbaceae bacterium]
MDKNIAELLLKNLLSRVVIDSETGQGTLSGVLSAMEIEALQVALELFTTPEATDLQKIITPAPPIDKKTKPKEEPKIEVELGGDEEKDESELEVKIETESVSQVKPRAEIKLNLASLEFKSPQDREITMCLDFGTAMSKAFAAMAEDGELVENLLLKLGHRASNGESKDIYPVPSSLWISNNGDIFLGEEAINLSLQSDSFDNRERFDSLKKVLILGLKQSTPFQQPMSASLNPTDVPLSMGDAIIIYLGFLTDLACTELEEAHDCSRYVVRNFGLPSWDQERREWGEKLLQKMLIKAQIVADTFHGQWKDGLNIYDVKSVLDKIDKLEELPSYLVSQGVTEPLAVASSKLQEDEPFRGLAMVVDVGAGTSDLALFVVVKDLERNLFNGFPVEGCNQSLRQAGDVLDTALQQMIMEKSGIRDNDPDRPYVVKHLRMQVRALKEDLFRDGDCAVNLINDTRVIVDRDEFLQHETVLRFKKNLAEKFDAVLKPMKEGVVRQYGKDGISIALTGGGATLPMVTELADGVILAHGINIPKDKMALVPEEFNYDPELALVYPQLAVAIGGSMPNIIDEKRIVQDMSSYAGGFVLARNPISGI